MTPSLLTEIEVYQVSSHLCGFGKF